MNPVHISTTVLTLVLVMSALAMTGCSTAGHSTTATRISTAIPPAFHGTWTHNQSGHHPLGEDPLVLSTKTLKEHETYGDVRSVSIHSENEITVVLDVSAEGDEFSDERSFRLSPDGSRLDMKSDGFVLPLYRVK